MAPEPERTIYLCPTCQQISCDCELGPVAPEPHPEAVEKEVLDFRGERIKVGSLVVYAGGERRLRQARVKRIERPGTPSWWVNVRFENGNYTTPDRLAVILEADPERLSEEQWELVEKLSAWVERPPYKNVVGYDDYRELHSLARATLDRLRGGR